MSDAEQLRLWREQLAREEDAEDSDDDGVGGYGVDDVHQPPDTDLGLALEDMPLPSRVPGGDDIRAAPPPRRVGRGPPSTGRPAPPPLTGGSSSDPPEVMMHKLQVLQLKLEEKEIELEAAKMGGAGGTGASAGLPDAREAKMKELARRCKAATMALGRERAKTAQLTTELAQLKRDASGGGGSGGSHGGAGAGAGTAGGPAARLESAAARVGEARDGVDAAARDRELKESKERLAAANARLHEAKMSAQALKAELGKHQRALAREVGEDVPLAKLLDETSGAKGRAQQISLLKEQVRTLTRKLQSNEGGEGTPAPGSPDAAEGRHRGALHAIEQERRRELERLLVREQELSAEVVEARKKLEAMGARIRNLETDVRSKKEKLKLLLDKSDADDNLVAALRAELDKQRTRSGGGAAAGDGPINQRRMGELASKAAQQQAQIDRQEQIILALRDQLQRQQADAAAAGSGPGSNRSGRPPQDLIAMQAENAKLRELVALLQEKLAEAEGAM